MNSADTRALLDAYLRQQIIASTLTHDNDDAASNAPSEPVVDLPDAATLTAFKQQVHEFIDLDDKIKKLQTILRQLNQEKRGLSDKILTFMRKYNIEDLNTRNGKLRYRMTYVKAPLSQKEIRNRLVSSYDSTKSIDEIARTMFETQKVARASLKRLYSRPALPAPPPS